MLVIEEVKWILMALYLIAYESPAIIIIITTVIIILYLVYNIIRVSLMSI